MTAAATLQPSLELAMGLTALLAASAGQKQHPARAPAAVPSWVPFLFLGIIAAASTAFGILYPDLFALAVADGVAAPESASIAAARF